MHQKGFFIIIIIIIIFIIIIGSIFIFLSSLLFESDPNAPQVRFGVSFSPLLADSLGPTNWQIVYSNILDDLAVKLIRIPTYWEMVEPSEGNMRFDEVDYMVEKAAERGVSAILVVGTKQPRWPECHVPDWARALPLNQRRTKMLQLIEQIVQRYKTTDNVWAWQIENEPLFKFGEGCDEPDSDFLKAELDLVRRADPKRQIILTDTGEWRSWITPMKLSDILGISVYRKAYNPIFGYITFPFPSFYYRMKSDFVRALFAPQNKATIIAELQAEPWLKQSFLRTGISEQLERFTVGELKSGVRQAKIIGFTQVYLWGVEWWYYMKEQGHPEYWEYAKTLF